MSWAECKHASMLEAVHSMDLARLTSLISPPNTCVCSTCHRMAAIVTPICSSVELFCQVLSAAMDREQFLVLLTIRWLNITTHVIVADHTAHPRLLTEGCSMCCGHTGLGSVKNDERKQVGLTANRAVSRDRAAWVCMQRNTSAGSQPNPLPSALLHSDTVLQILTNFLIINP